VGATVEVATAAAAETVSVGIVETLLSPLRSPISRAACSGWLLTLAFPHKHQVANPLACGRAIDSSSSSSNSPILMTPILAQGQAQVPVLLLDLHVQR